MIDDLKRELPAYVIRPITESNHAQVLDVLLSNQAYFGLFGEEKVDAQTCKDMICALPPDFDPQNKLLVGFWHGEQPVALMDVLMSHPTEHAIWIGLLLIHGEMHGQAIGRTIHDALARAAQRRGYRSIQLGVLAENEKALLFWQKLGYRIFRSTAASSPHAHDTHILAKDIDAHAKAPFS